MGLASYEMKALLPDIKALMGKNQELLEQDENKQQVVSFDIRIAGSEPANAEPTIIFISKIAHQRA